MEERFESITEFLLRLKIFSSKNFRLGTDSRPVFTKTGIVPSFESVRSLLPADYSVSEKIVNDFWRRRTDSNRRCLIRGTPL